MMKLQNRYMGIMKFIMRRYKMKGILEKGLGEKFVIETDLTKRLVMDNVAKVYPVYKIRLDKLYYNDQNDRIATWVSQYKTENNVDEINMENLDEYNTIIHNFVTESNREALRKTQTNMELIGQNVPGVVLQDGRIIDGNRRFTCLRNIEEKTGQTQYFEAVILDHNIKNDKKQIKMLELMLQHGIDEKIDYNPIDRLVGVYNDVIETGLLTAKEYAMGIGVKESEVVQEIEKAKLMVEFLEFINAPKQFHLARHFNIVDPLKELNTMLKRINDEDKKEDLKYSVFSQFLVSPEGDATRYMRKIKKIASNDRFLEGYLDEQVDLVEKVCDILEEHPEVKENEIAKIRSDEDLKRNFYQSTEKHLNKVNSDATRNQPIKLVEKAFDNLELIDLNILNKLSVLQVEEFSNNVKDLKEKINNLEKALELLQV